MFPPLCLALFLSFLYLVLASPRSIPRFRQSTPLHRHVPQSRTSDEWGQWAKMHKQVLMVKYGSGPPRKRSIGTSLITNQNSDSSFFGSLALGTPAVSYNVILDTGSADLWVADSSCKGGCTGIVTFNSAASSTFVTNNVPFNISYGSGEASGTLGNDVVQMAGFSVSNQIFGICDDVSGGLLTNPVSGLLGLAFKSIASSGATPFWQALAASGTWDSPLMAFQLTRFLDDSTAGSLEPGGSFTMGFVNTSLFTGDIEYVNLPTTESYWILPMTSLTVQGNAVQLPTGSDAYSAIDTGTTLVGGPPEYMSALYSQISGASAGSGHFEGYYTYPCNTTINVTIAFGGRNWPISAADFQLAQLTDTRCLGAFFNLETGPSAPAWIIGDTFLKNVYSVFRYDPPSVGFAQLSSTAQVLSDADGPVPVATIGSVAATVTATGRPRSEASGLVISRTSIVGLVMTWIVSLVTGLLF